MWQSRCQFRIEERWGREGGRGGGREGDAPKVEL